MVRMGKSLSQHASHLRRSADARQFLWRVWGQWRKADHAVSQNGGARGPTAVRRLRMEAGKLDDSGAKLAIRRAYPSINT